MIATFPMVTTGGDWKPPRPPRRVVLFLTCMAAGFFLTGLAALLEGLLRGY